MTKYDFLKNFIDFKELFEKDCYEDDGIWHINKIRYLKVVIIACCGLHNLEYNVLEYDTEEYDERISWYGDDKEKSFERYVHSYACPNIHVEWINKDE